MSLLACRVSRDRFELVTDTIAYGGAEGAMRFRADSPKRTLVPQCRSVIADVGNVILGDTWAEWAGAIDSALADEDRYADVDALAAAARRDHAHVYEVAQLRADARTADSGKRVQMAGGRIFAGWSDELGGYRGYQQYNWPEMLTFEQRGMATFVQPVPDGFTVEPPTGRDAWFDWVLDLRDAIVAAYPTDPGMVLIGGDVTYTVLEGQDVYEELLVSFGDAEDEFGLLRHLDSERAEHLATLDAMAKVGRNDRCPCGSGRKFKVCHLDASRTAASARA